MPRRPQAPNRGGDQVTCHDSRTRIAGSQFDPAQVDGPAAIPGALARPFRQPVRREMDQRLSPSGVVEGSLADCAGIRTGLPLPQSRGLAPMLLHLGHDHAASVTLIV